MNVKVKAVAVIGGLSLSLFLMGCTPLTVHSGGQDKQQQDNTQTAIPRLKTLKVENDLQQYGIEIIGSNAPDFDSTLAEYTGGNKESLSLVDSVNPFAVFIKNSNKKNLVGIRLKWTFIKPNREQRITFSGMVNPGILMGDKTAPLDMVRFNCLINSGDRRLFNYISDDVDSSIYSGWLYKNYDLQQDAKSLEGIKRSAESQRSKLLSNFSDAVVSIDSIVFEDGTFAGQNKDFFFEWVSGYLQARRDIIKEIRKLKAEGKSNDETLQIVVDSDKTEDPGEPWQPKDSKSAFDYSYTSRMRNQKREIAYRRSKNISADMIVNEFLLTQDSDVITLQKIKKQENK